MRLRSESGAPARNRSVEKALQRLDPGLYVIWRDWMFDRSTGNILFVKGKTGLEPVWYPRWWVCLDNRFGQHVLFEVETPDKQFRPLDYRVIERLTNDIGRQSGMTESKANTMIDDALAAKKREDVARVRNDEADFCSANSKKISEAMAAPMESANDLSHTVRETKVFSYAGKKSFRSTAEQQRVQKSASELGWELPESFK